MAWSTEIDNMKAKIIILIGAVVLASIALMGCTDDEQTYQTKFASFESVNGTVNYHIITNPNRAGDNYKETDVYVTDELVSFLEQLQYQDAKVLQVDRVFVREFLLRAEVWYTLDD